MCTLKIKVMKRSIRKFALLISLMALFTAQETHAQKEGSKRTISVIGQNEIKVVPDRLFLEITLLEGIDGKNAISVKDQEDTLFMKLNQIGYKLNKVSLQDISSMNYRYRRNKIKQLTRSTLILPVSNSDTLYMVLDIVSNLPNATIEIDNIEHTQIDSLKLINGRMAIANARKQAMNYLSVTNDSLGKVLQIEPYSELRQKSYSGMVRGNSGVPMSAFEDIDPAEYEIEFRKIVVFDKVHVVFEIK